MKLVEILARDLNEWPSKQVPSIEQAVNGELVYNLCHPPSIEEMDYKHSGVLLDRALDWVNACITRPQWQAERDRMKAMEAPRNTRTQDELIAEFNAALSKPTPLEKTPEPTYEQQLWDRVALQEIESHRGRIDKELSIRVACEYADAFMAERAKRIKGVA